VIESLLGVNALMAGTFLLLYSNDSVVRALFVMNNVLVISFTVAMIVYLFLAPAETVPDLKTLRIVILVWGVFVIYNNLRGWLPEGSADFEFIGFGVFLGSLGYLVAQRSLRTEEALVAIRNELKSPVASKLRSSQTPCPHSPA
jgi:archaellum biogenesis protein FlaJ (TadC family)